MSDAVTNIGLHFDEVNKLRILEPEVSKQTIQLKDECSEFLLSIESFKSIADGFIRLIDSLGGEVEKEKMKAIGSRNLVKSITKQRDSQEKQLQALILEKSTELERLRIQHQSLMKSESEQMEVLDRFVLNH